MVRLIIIERLAKAAVLIVLAISLLVIGRRGLLTQWATEAQQDLVLETGSGFFQRLVDRVLLLIGTYRHLTALSVGLIVYAGLEATEGIGLALRRRWAEYLTVLATTVGIPYEALEVLHRVTPFRVGALLLNVAIVVYLAWRKRIFLDV